MAEQYGGTIRWVFEADDTQFNQAVDNVKDKATELNEAVKAADKSVSSLGKTSKNQGREVSNAFATIGNAIKGISFSLLTAGATAAAGALTNMTKKGIEGADALAKYNSQIIGLANSTVDANSAMSTAVSFFKNNPFQRFETIEAVKNLMQYDKSIADASTGSQKLRKTLDMLGVASLSTGTNIAELASQWGEISGSSKVSIGQLDEFAMRVPAIWDAIGKKVGKSAATVREAYLGIGLDAKVVKEAMQDLYGLDTEKLNGSKEEVEAYLNTLTGAARQSAEAYLAFGNTMARQTDRVKGRLADMQAAIAGYTITVDGGFQATENGIYQALINLKKAFADTLASSKPVGQKMAQAFNKISEAIAPFINTLAEKLPGILDRVFTILDKVADVLKNNRALLVPIAAGILTFFGKLASQIPIVNNILGSFTSNIDSLVVGIKRLARANPVLAVFFGIFAGGLVAAMKNSEQFRESIGKIFSSLGTILSKITPVIQELLEVFAQIISSPAIISILEGVAGALAGVAEALASMPTEVLTFLVSSILTIVALNKLNPWVVFATGVITAIAAISRWIDAIGGIKNVPKEIGKFFANLPNEMIKIGQNIISGLIKGLSEAAGWLWQSIKNIANGVVQTFQAVLGIHSPSTVMKEQGEYVGLGLAEGITDSKSVVQRAMSNLAKAILQTSQKVISNKADFGVLDVKGQYNAWKQVSKLFVKGSEEYVDAMEQMEEARKKANLQILSLQNNYNDALDDSIDRVKKFYGLFQSVTKTGGSDSSKILKNLDEQLASMQGFSEAQKIIENLNLDESLVDELKSMGIDATSELQAIANMTGSELDTLNSLWKQKQELANDTAITLMDNLKDSTLEQIQEIKNGIDGETIDIRDVGGRLVSEISEGITGAIPTLKDAYAQLGDYIKKATKELSGSGKGTSAGGLGKVGSLDTTNLANDAKKTIEESMQKLGSNLGWIAGGILGGAVLFKIGGALLNKFNKGKEIKEVTKVLKNIGGTSLGKEAASATENIKSVGNVTESMGKMGEQTSKYTEVLKKIALTLAVVIEAAVAIAAVAGAIWVVNQAIPDNIGVVIPKLAVVAMAIAGIGALAWIGGYKDNWKGIAKGLALILGIAADLALVALALGEVNKNIPDNIGIIIPKLAIIALAIVGMGALSAIAGIAWQVIGAGLLAMLGISGNIALAAKAVGEIDKNIPDDVSKMPDKIKMMALAILAFEGLSAIAGIAFAAIGLGLWGLSSITGQIIATSDALRQVNENIPDDYGKLKSKVEAMAEIIKYISGQSFGGFLENLKQEWDMKPLKNTMDMFSQCAYYVGEIAKVNFNPSEINSKIDALTTVINHLAGEEVHGHSGGLLGFVQGLFGGVSYEDAAKQAANSMRSLGEISKVIMNDFPKGDIDVQHVKKTIGSLSEIIENIQGRFPNDGEMQARSITVYYAEGLIHNLKEFITSTNEIPKISRYEEIYDTIEDGGWLVGGAIQKNFPNDSEMESRGITVDHARNLLDRLAEFITSTNSVPAFSNYDSSYDTIEQAWWILSALSKEVNVDEDMENRGITVDNARNLLDRLKEFVVSANQITGGANLENVSKAIEDFKVIVKQLAGVFVSSKQEFQSVGAQIIQSIIDGAMSKSDSMYNTGKVLVLKLGEGVFASSPEMKKPGSQLGQDIIGGIEQTYGKLAETGRNVGNKVKDGMREVDYSASGRYAVDGFVNGILSKGSLLTRAGREMAELFLRAFKKKAGEGSPWKTTYQSGQFAVEGLIEGLASMQESVVSEAELIADSVVEAFESSNPTITPDIAYAGSVAPAMDMGVTGYGRSGGVIIEQTNNNYTQYDIEKVNRDLSWELAKV